MNVWGVSTRDAVRLVRAGLIGAGAELAGLALMATAAWLLLKAAEQPPLASLTVAIVAVRTLALARGGLRYAERLAGHEVVLRYLGALRTRVYTSLLPHRVSRHSGGDLVTRLVSDVDAVQDAILRCLLPAGVAAFVGSVSTAIALIVSPAAGLVLALGLAVAGIGLPWLCVRITRAAAEKSAPARADLAERSVELITGRRELIAYGVHESTVDAAHTAVDSLASRDRATANRTSLLTAAGILVQLLTCVTIALTAGVSRPQTAALALGALAVFELVLPLTAAAQRWVEVRASAGRVRALLTEPPPARGSAVPEPGHLRLEGVGVRFEGRAPALDGVDLDLPPGKRVGIVGPSGAGKTTLLNVLLGSVAPTSGRAVLNGRALDEYDPALLSTVVSGALADAHVFHTTVRENLLLAKPGAADSELLSACATAGFDLPLDREVGFDGDTLSGGQRQRLVLARAVLAAPPVLVLDEPVEGLDPEHGDAVLADVLAAARGTVVLVTHRESQVAGFDEVVRLGS
ncbi:thiol reductant ABC exporter subunit CydC [Amycolatopsis sp. WAC 01375]|uniref:thiol reductant ABC exporter subunit CydC n=1 Tax=Amycolatopsis sp. WAC 01375 TaxID=2203194 RepID=UPI000F7B693B|nr:thiol reductant ABC exporter subunit CydC [Amycolatopsis sp. WAC 01375]RSM82909.1 thiol reductant ABC exporter subunit CydC [Amycolatopsis sp. WAC 01375]